MKRLHRTKALALYGEYYYSNIKQIDSLLLKHGEKRIAVWGAGLKGEAFLNIVDPHRNKIFCVVDKNEKKNGTCMSTGHRVISPSFIKKSKVRLIISMNYNYADSIKKEVADQDASIETVCLDIYLLQHDKSVTEPDYKMGLDQIIVGNLEFCRERYLTWKRNISDIRKAIGRLGGYKREEVSPIFFYYGQYDNVACKSNEGEAYGLFECLKRYSGFTKYIYARAEHGLYFNDWVFYPEAVEANVPALLTYSSFRKDVLKQKSRHLIYPVGPYIHYGTVPYTEFQINMIKSNLGKTLLVFPEHSSDGAEVSADTEASIEKIRRFKEKYHFQSVMVCFHYWDIAYGKHFRYLQEGWIPVTAGIGNSIKFYDNLKTIITLSDFCLNSGLGTSLGYCVYLKKGTMLYNLPEDVMFHTDKNTNQPLENTEDYLELGRDEKLLTQLFSEYHETVTQEQYDICRRMWGFHEIRSKEEILIALKTIRRIAICGGKTENGFRKYARFLYKKSKDKGEKKFLKEVVGEL